MQNLLLTEELAHALLGALLAVCRADGDANVEELKALRTVGHELSGGVRYDNEWLLFFSHMTPRGLAEAVRDAGAEGPFRGQAVSASHLIAQEFVTAAVKVARADGALNAQEIRLICSFARELQISSKYLEYLDNTLDAWEGGAAD
jgi:tellurite resistance protein